MKRKLFLLPLLFLLCALAMNAQGWKATRTYRGSGAPPANLCQDSYDPGIVYTDQDAGGKSYTCQRTAGGDYEWHAVTQADKDGNVLIGTTMLDATWGLLIPQMICDGSTVCAYDSGAVVVNKSAMWWNNAAGALTFNLPPIAATATPGSALVGTRLCFGEMAGKTGAITLKAPASTAINNKGTKTADAGSVASAGAADDNACVVALSTTEYKLYIGSGTWN